VTALDRILPEPALVERHFVDVAAPAARVWPHARHLDLARIRWVWMLFALRTLPDRIAGAAPPLHVRIDDLVSSRAAPGFQILTDEPFEVTVGAIGKVWRLAIPFVHVDGAEAFAAFRERGFVKVAWAIRVVPRPREPRPTGGCRVEVEVRVRANDPASWRLFRRYFRIIGPASRLIRRAALAQLAREVERRSSESWLQDGEAAVRQAAVTGRKLHESKRAGAAGRKACSTPRRRRAPWRPGPYRSSHRRSSE
jgi:hypothetical protein